MPKAPERTRKQKRQLAQQDYEKGNVQEFPGAPIWNEWVNEQREAKKREIGLPRRIGRAALETAAVAVVVAKQTPRAVSQYREQNNALKAKRLQRVVNRSNSAEAIPDTDLRKVEKSRMRRLGRGIMSVLNRSNERSLSRTNQKVERLAGKNKANRQANVGPVEAWASNKLNTIDKKRMDTHLRRSKQFEAETDVAWGKYLKENPEVEKRLIAEQKQRDKQFEVNAQNKRYQEMQSNASFATEYFVKRNSYSFSKALPRGLKPAAYDELAKSTVEYAAKNRQEDGKITLFSPHTLANVVQEKMPLSADGAPMDGPRIFDGENRNTNFDFHNSERQLWSDIGDRKDYTGGVATSLWKMGFVEFDSEADISSGNGHRMNEAIEWSRGEDGTTFASIPYNPENELHQIIGGEHADPSSATIQLAINDTQRYAPEVSVNLVEQPALVHA